MERRALGRLGMATAVLLLGALLSSWSMRRATLAERSTCAESTESSRPAARLGKGMPGGALALSVYGDSSCAADKRGAWWCWGALPLVGFNRFSHVQPRWARTRDEGGPPAVRYNLRARSCVLRQDHSVLCRADANAPQTVVYHRERLSELQQNGDMACGIEPDRSVWCSLLRTNLRQWTDAEEVVALRGSEEIALGDSQLCGRNGERVQCVNAYGAFDSEVHELRLQAKQLVGAREAACALGVDGALACWGSDATPRYAAYAAEWKLARLASGGTRVCGSNAKQVACWELAELSAPPQVADGFDDIAQLSLNGDVTCALERSHAVRCWGRNALPHFANGDPPPSLQAPLTVAGIAPADSIRVSELDACATTDGYGSCWPLRPPVIERHDSFDPLTQDGAWKVRHRFAACSIDRQGWLFCGTYPTSVNEPVRSVAVGNEHACAIRRSGAAFCWGDNSAGQVTPAAARGTQNFSVTSVRDHVKSIALGLRHTCATFEGDAADRVDCWGENGFGQLGDENPLAHQASLRVPQVTAWSEVAAGTAHSCALSVDGAVWCWGSLDSARGTRAATPRRVPLGDRAVSLRADGEQSCALSAAGQVACWAPPRCTKEAGCSFALRTLPSPEPLIEIAVGERHVCAISASEAVLCAGANDHGQLGTHPPAERNPHDCNWREPKSSDHFVAVSFP